MTVTIIIIGITVLISMASFSNPRLMQGLMMNPWAIRTRGQYYRFISSGFIHGSHMHLLVNMFSFYFFGTAMESVFGYVFGASGNYVFVALYLSAMVVSDFPTFLQQKNNPAYNALGASGAVSAIIFAFIIFLPLQKICLYAVFCIPGFIAGTLYVIYSYYQGRRSNDNINHDAHLFGAIFGVIFCVVAYPPCVSNFFEQIKGWIAS